MFLSSDFALMRTSGEYIALAAERQSKSAGCAFPASMARDVK
jgi:hypothetical protein